MHRLLWSSVVSLLFVSALPAQTKTIAERLGHPRDSKLLIIHADDLGAAHSIDAASFDALEKGAISSASAMVPTPWITEVAAYARAHPDADLGLHLTLTSEWETYRWGSVASPDEVPSLLDPSGTFPNDEKIVAARAKPAEAEREIRAQIERALALGIRPTHLDSHMGALFTTPDLLATYVKVAREYHLPFLAPRGDPRVAPQPPLSAQDVLVDAAIIATREVPRDKWKEFYLKSIADLKPGLTEMIVHLGHDESELQAVMIDHEGFGSAWRQKDYDVVNSAEFKKALRDNHVIVVTWKELGRLLPGSPVATGPSPAVMAAAATKFLESLSPEQQKRATFAFAGDERTHWNFIPTELFPRNGLTIREMNQSQQRLAHELLKAGLSQRGYMTATQVMELENVLAALEAAARAAGPQSPQGNQFVRDPERYFFSIFGTPSTRNTWAYRVEGHHMSLHFTVANGTLVAGSPSFFGSNPAEVRSGPKKGTRVLGPQEDAARLLLESLDASQRERAIITGVAPNDIVTMNKVKIDPLSPAGIPASALSPGQRALLRKLIDVYAGYMAADIAADRLTRIEKAGWDRVAFAWAGALERGQKHYYRVQGPTFLIEYDNTQNDGNHVHSVWRDFNGDFGEDLLREHVNGTPHGH
ncbi:MAG TPA: DUF3500 domain-containing protein [Gemmatimonadaceae bacterium]|nr:DUF3500 domain-containing protein [Gemmatimonadaceae bacterium]